MEVERHSALGCSRRYVSSLYPTMGKTDHFHRRMVPSPEQDIHSSGTGSPILPK